jgi:tyrosyl-tRNA synthetase
MAVLDALVALGFVASRGEGKRKFAENAVKIDGETVTSPDAVVVVTTDIKLSLGKKRHGILTPQG